MNFYEKPTNVAARASSGGERSRWRDENVDPELVMDPFDTLQSVLAARAAKAEREAKRPLSHQVAAYAVAHEVSTTEYSPPLLAVSEDD